MDGYRRAESWPRAVRATLFLASHLSLTSPRQAGLTLQVRCCWLLVAGGGGGWWVVVVENAHSSGYGPGST